jgi:hypothetical protein
MPPTGAAASPRTESNPPRHPWFARPTALEPARGRLLEAPASSPGCPVPMPLPFASFAPPVRRPPPHRLFAAAATGLAALILILILAGLGGADASDDFAGSGVSWALGESDAHPRVVAHEGSPGERGAGSERIVLEAGPGTQVRLETPIGPAAVIDELACAARVRSNRTDIRLAVRVTLPDYVSTKTGRPVEALVPGTMSRDIDRWEVLEADGLPRALARQLPALRLEHGPQGSLAGAVATHLVLDAYTGPGRYEIAIDDVVVRGVVEPAGGRGPRRDPAVRPATATAPADPPAGLTRGVLEVDGLPFFPRALEHNGEPLSAIAALGFNCVQVATPASGELLAEARQAGLWVICPPPEIPDVDLRDPESVPTLRNWDRVLMWDLGRGLGEADVESLAERARRVRACDHRPGRPLIAGSESGLRAISRHVDMLVARRTLLGTSLEFADYLTWLRERPRLARPGTPLVATLATEIDPRAAAQAAAIAGVGGRGLAVDPESLAQAALAAVAGGARGILFTSTARIDAADREARKRAAAARDMNLRLSVLDPWGAAGRFAAQAHTSNPDVQAVVMEAARARMVVAWRSVQGSQIVARRYGGGDLPGAEPALTLLVPGVPEAHQAWLVAPGGLRPLQHRRITGGVTVALDSFLSHAIVLVSGEPAVTAHVQSRLRELAPAELEAARALAATALEDAADLLARLPPEAFSGPPPVAAVPMLTAAQRQATEAEALAAGDPAEAVVRLRLAAAIAGQFERRIWENGVAADGSMVASPLAVSDGALGEHWRFVAARAAATPGQDLLAGGGMDRIEDLSGNGWRHVTQPLAAVRTSVEITRDRPASGSGSLRLTATPRDPAAPPIVVETPPVWVTTPAVEAAPGTLLEISARVRVAEPIAGSVDGLLVFDSLGGPALAERVGKTGTWRRLVLHRIVAGATARDPVSVTFALTGLGTAEIDDVSIRPLERTAQPAPATGLATAQPRGESRPFPGPADLLTPPVTLPAPRAPPAAATPQWPGMKLDWPRVLPFAQPSTTPPPGPGGGTIDPFKRARQQATPTPDS